MSHWAVKGSGARALLDSQVMIDGRQLSMNACVLMTSKL